MAWARRRRIAERRVRKSDTPIVGLDYLFPSFGEGVMLTVLIAVEIFSGAVEAILVQRRAL